MTLSRLVNYVDGNTLTGAQLNNEFDNILNNGPSLVSASLPGVSQVQGLRGSIVANVASFAANGYQLKSTASACSLTATSSYSINTQTVGPVAGGRDQVAVFGSTDVHFYAITTGGTSTVAAGIASTRTPELGPTLPAGYTAWAYLASAKYSTGSSAVFVPAGSKLYVQGARLSYDVPINNLVTGTMGYSSTGEVLVSLSSVIPAPASECQLQLYNYRVQTAAAGTSVSGILTLRAETAVDYTYVYNAQAATTALALSPPQNGNFAYALRSTQSHRIYYSHGFISGTSAGFTMDLLGFSIPNGDVG